MTEKKTSVDEIIGIVTTEEATDSVEEVRKLRGRETMTGQRFKVTDNTDNPFLCDWSVTDYADGGIVHHPMTSENMANVMCDLLNQLNDENEQLKHRLAISEKANFVTTLEKENEHIKHTIKTMMENERTELGQSVLRQLWEAIQ